MPKLLSQRLIAGAIAKTRRFLVCIPPQRTPILTHVPLSVSTRVPSQGIQGGIIRMTHDELSKRIETVSRMLHGIAQLRLFALIITILMLILQLKEEFPHNLETVQLMITLQKIESLRFVAGNRHGIWPVLLRGERVVESHVAVGGVDVVPERVGYAAVRGTVACIPVELDGFGG